jgi:hypothetical protein
MKLRTILAASAVAALVAPGVSAAQQPPPINGGTEVGGTVSSFLELGITQPAKGFAAFSKSKSYSMTFDALATATDGSGTQLSIADGDATSGSKLGHLSIAGKRLKDPLEATVGKAAFQPLDASTDPVLNRWNDAMTKSKATVKLRQKITKKTKGSYHKLVLVTLSTETP